MPQSNWSAGRDIIVESVESIYESVRGWVHGPTMSDEDLTQLQHGLSYADHAMAAAEHVAEFRQAEGAVERLRRSRQAIGHITNVLEGIQLFREVNQIRQAVNELHRIGNVSRDPAAAARSFGLLLSGLGGLCGHLPPPANAYGDFLADSGNFFTNMIARLHPDQRWHHRPDGRAVDLSRPPVF